MLRRDVHVDDKDMTNLILLHPSNKLQEVSSDGTVPGDPGSPGMVPYLETICVRLSPWFKLGFSSCQPIISM